MLQQRRDRHRDSAVGEELLLQQALDAKAATLIDMDGGGIVLVHHQVDLVQVQHAKGIAHRDARGRLGVAAPLVAGCDDDLEFRAAVDIVDLDQLDQPGRLAGVALDDEAPFVQVANVIARPVRRKPRRASNQYRMMTSLLLILCTKCRSPRSSGRILISDMTDMMSTPGVPGSYPKRAISARNGLIPPFPHQHQPWVALSSALFPECRVIGRSLPCLPALAEGRQPQLDAAHQLACRRRQRPAQPQQRLAFRRAQDRMRDGQGHQLAAGHFVMHAQVGHQRHAGAAHRVLLEHAQRIGGQAGRQVDALGELQQIHRLPQLVGRGHQREGIRQDVGDGQRRAVARQRMVRTGQQADRVLAAGAAAQARSTGGL